VVCKAGVQADHHSVHQDNWAPELGMTACTPISCTCKAESFASSTHLEGPPGVDALQEARERGVGHRPPHQAPGEEELVGGKQGDGGSLWVLYARRLSNKTGVKSMSSCPEAGCSSGAGESSQGEHCEAGLRTGAGRGAL
jgi:hypothetical protein